MRLFCPWHRPSSRISHAVVHWYRRQYGAWYPISFSPRHSPCVLPYPYSWRSAHQRSKRCSVRSDHVWCGPRQPDFFNACSSRLNSSSEDFSFHCLKYVYTVLLAGKSLGIMSHWHPLFNTYKTAQKTSYKSTFLGLVFFLALSSSPSIFANCSRLISLGYTFLIHTVYDFSCLLAKRSRIGSKTSNPEVQMHAVSTNNNAFCKHRSSHS